MAVRGRRIGRSILRPGGTSLTTICLPASSTFWTAWTVRRSEENIMKKQFIIAALLTAVSLVLFITPAMSHHSFAMYDQTKTVTWTGVMTRFVAQANHAEIHFVPLGPDGKPMRGSDGKPITWGVEMAGAAAVANQGITVNSFPVGTIFSVKL